MSTVRASGAGVMAKYFPAASDDALLSLLRNEWIAILSEYRSSDSRACVAFLGGDSNVNFARAFPSWDVSRALVVRENVMRTGASQTPIPVDKRAANEDLQTIVASLAGKYGNDVQLLDKESEWMDNSRKVCDILLAMYQQIAALPKKRAANVMRYLVISQRRPLSTPTWDETSPLPSPKKYISTDPNAGEPIPRARPVKKVPSADAFLNETPTPIGSPSPR